MTFNFMKQHGLNTSICFFNKEEMNSFVQLTGNCAPLEDKVFSLLKDHGRIY